MTPELLDDLERLEKESHENSFRMTAYLSKLQDAAPSLIQSLRSLMYGHLLIEMHDLKAQLRATQDNLRGAVDAMEKLSKAARNLLNQELNGVDCDAIDRVFQALPPRSPEAKLGAAQKEGGMHPNWYSEDSVGTVYSKAHGDSEVTCRSCKRTFLTDPMDAACRLCGNWFSAKRAAQKEGGK